MALSAQEVKILLTAQNQASAALKAVEADLNRLGNSAKSAGPSWLSMASAVSVGTTAATAFMGVARGLTGIFTSAAASSADFGQSMADIRSLVPTADFDRFGGQVQQLALKLGKDYPLSAAEAGKAMTLMAQKGISVEQMLNGGAEAVVKLSSATGADLVTSAGIAANALDTFNVAAEDMGSVTNLMVGAMTRGGVSATDYGFAMAASGAVIKLAGGDVEDFSIAVAAMAKAGIEGSDAGTSLKSMYMNLQPTTKAAIATARELGIITKDGSNQFFDAAGNVKSYEQISAVLAESLKGLTKEQQLMKLETIFGSDAIRAAAVAAKLGAGEYGNLGEQIRNVDAGDVAAKRMDSLKGAITQFTGSAETASLMLMGGLTPALKEIIDWATEGINAAMPNLEAFGATIGTAFSAGVATAKDWFRQLVDAWNTVKDAFAGNWAPDASIEPLALAAGNAALKLKDLSEWAGRVAEAAGRMGAWDNFASGLATVRTEGELAQASLGKIASQLENLTRASTGSSQGINLVAAGVRIVATAFELWALSIGQAIDTVTTFASTALSFIGILGNLGRAVVALATGDMETFQSAQRDAAQSFLDLVVTTNDFSTRTVERVGQAYQAITGHAQTGMAEQTAAVEAGMSEASAAASAGYLEMASAADANLGEMATTAVSRFAELSAAAGVGTAEAVAAVDAGMAAVGPAVDANMAAAVVGVQAGGEQMAAAASAGAASAVAAVEGQTGAASGAGQSLGSALGSGLEGGIMAYVGRVAAAAASLVSAAIGAAHVEADAHSPSRKTEKLGKDLADGLEIGLTKSGVGEAMIGQIRDFIRAAGDYVPVGREIARVESEIKDIRDRAQTEALFRQQDMIDVESELLRMKRDQAEAERLILPIRQDLADAERAIRDISAGSLQDRTQLLDFDTQRKQLRLQSLDLEKQLLTVGKDESRKKQIQGQIDALRDQDRALGLEQDRIRLTNDLASTAARQRALGLGEILTAQERATEAVSRQIAVLGAEEAVFRANEAIIKNATDNEIAYRNRLIAVFTAEGKPLADRIIAGLALVEQLEKEGKISKELADQLRKIGQEAGISSDATRGLGAAAATAAPQMDAAAQKAKQMAEQAEAIARATKDAADDVLGLGKALNTLPSWFTPKGSKGSSSVPSLFSSGADGGGSADRMLATLVQPVATTAGAAGGSSGGAGGGNTYITVNGDMAGLAEDIARVQRQEAYLRAARRA